MKRKKCDIRIVILGVVVLIGIMIGFSVKSMKDDKDLNFIEKTVKDSINYVCKIALIPVDYINDKIEYIKESKSLYKKYNKLKEKVQKTEIYYAQIEELQKEVTELKSALELNGTLSEYTYKNATVINRNIGYWYNSLTIDKGSKNGISKGDCVIVSNGLVGKISSVGNFTSTVKLFTSDEITNKVSVKIKSNDKYAYGLFAGYDQERKVYKIEGIDSTSDIKEGDLVTTTGLTDYFPSGIVIGYVKKIVSDQYDLTSIVEVKPSVSYDDISVVTILKRKVK